MTKYCQEAKQYGELPHPAQKAFSKVLVILNPVADKRSAAGSVSFAFCVVANWTGLSANLFISIILV